MCNIALYCGVLRLWRINLISKYVGPRCCLAEMYAGRVARCRE